MTQPPLDAYVICTAPRSGSTLLCRMLAATGVAGDPQSYFHGPSIGDWLAYFAIEPSDGASPREVMSDVIRAAIARGRGASALFGLRLQRHSAPHFLAQLSTLHPELSSDRARLEASFGRIAFLHLHRPDKLAQAISYLKAQQTGLWHRAPDGTELERLAAPAEPRYDSAAIQSRIDEFTAFDRAWRSWFASENIEPFRIDYDELAAAPRATLTRTLAFLGLDPAAASGVDPGVAKLADATSEEWAARFRSERRRP